MTVRVVHDAGALKQHAAEWDALAAAALESNIFYESWMLLPAARLFSSPGRLIYALVYVESSERPGDPPLLCGFFPLERRMTCRGMPVATLALWRHLHCFLCTPLLRASHAREALAAFLDWAGRAGGAALVEFGHVSADGPFRQLLVDVLAERQSLYDVPQIFNRAVLHRMESADAFFRSALSPRTLKEMRRLRRRLAETGRLAVRVPELEAECELCLRQYLQLEASGWKGTRGAGTAMALSRRESAFVGEVWREARRRGRLQLIGLYLDERPVAIAANLLAGDGGFHFKISYDESLARFSPGVQLELELIRHVHACPGLSWLDSCATPNHSMINRLWPGRRTVHTLLMSTGAARGDLAVSVLPLLRWAKRLWQRLREPSSHSKRRTSNAWHS